MAAGQEARGIVWHLHLCLVVRQEGDQRLTLSVDRWASLRAVLERLARGVRVCRLERASDVVRLASAGDGYCRAVSRITVFWYRATLMQRMTRCLCVH